MGIRDPGLSELNHSNCLNLRMNSCLVPLHQAFRSLRPSDLPFLYCLRDFDFHHANLARPVGDGFMAAGGLLQEVKDPIGSAVRCGLEMASTLIDAQLGWEVRVGVHSGPVVAGVVGQERYQFDIRGDTVNVAARMSDKSTPRKRRGHEGRLGADRARFQWGSARRNGTQRKGYDFRLRNTPANGIANRSAWVRDNEFCSLSLKTIAYFPHRWSPECSILFLTQNAYPRSFHKR
jgi:adenylate/guanylate cyclase family protein